MGGEEVEKADGAAGGKRGEDRREKGLASPPILPELPEHGLPLLELEREVIVRALAKHGGNRTRTAEYLAIPRHVLLYRMEKYGIQ